MLSTRNAIFGWTKNLTGRLNTLTKTNSTAETSMHGTLQATSSFKPGIGLIPSLLKAAMIYMGVNYRDGESNPRAALGKTTTGEWVAELASMADPNLVTIVAYDPKTGKVKGGTLDTLKKKMRRYAIGNGSSVADIETTHTSDGTAVWLCVLPEILKETEAASLLDLVAQDIADYGLEKKGDLNAPAKNSPQKIDDNLATFCHNVYVRTTNVGKLSDIEIEDVGAKSKVGTIGSLSLASLKNKKYVVSETIIGKFAYVEIGKGTAKVALDRKDTSLGLSFPDAVQPFMIHSLDGYVATKTCADVLKVQKMGIANPELGINNFFFIGPPGSGKSEDTRGIAYYAGIPHYVQCLSSGITEETLKGIIVPTTSDEILTEEERKVVGTVAEAFPSEVEIDLDTKHAYEKLTGQKKENITAIDVYEEAYAKLLAYAKSEGAHAEGNGITYRYIPSPLVLAGKFGGLVEVQEPSSVTDPTVMTCLNEFMNKKDGVLDTPVGPVRRHPNCIVIMTDNYSNDIGNSNMNQAVKDRAGTMTFWYDRADKEHMIEMIKAAGISIKEKFLPIMAETIEAMDTEAQKMDNSIKAVAGYRSFNAWAKAMAMGFSLADAFELCVLNKMATNPEEREFLKEFAEINTRVYIEEE